MPITIAKDAGAGAGSDTTYTINNFKNLSINGKCVVEVLPTPLESEDNVKLIDDLAPQVTISFDWTLTGEASTVVSGAGGSVTTAVGQQKYLFDTLLSKSTDKLLDLYTLTIDYGDGVTYAKTGKILNITCNMSDAQPLTFEAHIDFQVGTTP